MNYRPPYIYPKSIPTIIPSNRVLVHNSVRPARRQGWRGARYWLQELVAGLEQCDCGWAPEHPVHYRVAPQRWVERES